MFLLHKANIVTALKNDIGSILIDGDIIKAVFWKDEEGMTKVDDKVIIFDSLPETLQSARVINLEGKHIIAGGIDAHVHFRDPGLSHKADMRTESRAAAAGGVTTVFDMPNTIPAAISAGALADKIALAKDRSTIKIGFHIGASNSNAGEICRLVREGDPETGLKAEDIPGVKVFMGSSTGNMLVDDSSR